MGKKVTALLLVVILGGMLFAQHTVYAHNFVQNSSADLIAKIQEFKTESNLIANNISNTTLAQWHVTKSQEYWGTNELNGLSQQDSTMASNLSTAIDDLYSLTAQPNVDKIVAMQKANALNQILDQAESKEISSLDQSNATIQSLAIIGVLKEALTDYGEAIGSKVDLNNMSNMNMQNTSSNMQGMAGMQSSISIHIVNVAAYQSAQALVDTAQNMSNNLKSITPSSSETFFVKIDSALNELKQSMAQKESGNDAMMIVHMKIHPNFISAFNIQVVPEFPFPIVLALISFIGIVAMSRVVPKLH